MYLYTDNRKMFILERGFSCDTKLLHGLRSCAIKSQGTEREKSKRVLVTNCLMAAFQNHLKGE